MDANVVKNALGGLELILNDAKEALWQVQGNIFGNIKTPEGGIYDDPEGALAFHLERLHDALLMVLEAAELPLARALLVENWNVYKKAGLYKTKNDPEYGGIESAPLTFLLRQVGGLRMTVMDEFSSEEAWIVGRLEGMLEDTSALIHRKGIVLGKEQDLKVFMHDYLRACFPTFEPKPEIGGSLKKFKPDCGVRNVRAAIEFKIVHNEKQAATAFSGIVEDSAGYKGSRDWTRFYAVIYQAKPFIAKSQLEYDMKRIGATTWKAFLVNNATQQKPKPSRQA